MTCISKNSKIQRFKDSKTRRFKYPRKDLKIQKFRIYTLTKWIRSTCKYRPHFWRCKKKFLSIIRLRNARLPRLNTSFHTNTCCSANYLQLRVQFLHRSKVEAILCTTITKVINRRDQSSFKSNPSPVTCSSAAFPLGQLKSTEYPMRFIQRSAKGLNRLVRHSIPSLAGCARVQFRSFHRATALRRRLITSILLGERIARTVFTQDLLALPCNSAAL